MIRANEGCGIRVFLGETIRFRNTDGSGDVRTMTVTSKSDERIVTPGLRIITGTTSDGTIAHCYDGDVIPSF